MTYRGLAYVLLRCSAVISMVVGLVRVASYVPMMWDMPWGKGAGGYWRTVFFPSAAEVVGGVLLFLLAGSLSKVLARGAESEPVA